MSPPGGLEGEFRRLQRGGSQMSPLGRPKSDFRSAQSKVVQ